MIKHLSARLAWHMNGWNGHICQDPKANTYCVGQYSYPGDLISVHRDRSWETQVAGECSSNLEKIPPCVYSINAFGKKQLTAYADPPDWFRDGSETKYWDLPPATVCIWPYEEMYTDDVKFPEGTRRVYDYDKRFERAQRFFEEITPKKSLIFYYANYSNPLSEDDAKKYVLVGVSRIKQLGDFLYYDGISEENKRKYAGGFVWQMPITSYYPDQGFRIPYHLYLDQPEQLQKVLYVPENERNFKYAARHVTDDDALDLVENLLVVVDNLLQMGDGSDDWIVRREWLQSLVAELWQNRGAYPGLPNVLSYLGLHDLITYFRQQTLKEREQEAKEEIFAFLNSSGDRLLDQISLGKEQQRRMLRQWKVKSEQARQLLENVLPRFDLPKEQIEKIVSDERAGNGITGSLSEISENPYLLSEQFMGDGPDDRITFNKIDHGVFPSPELGLHRLADPDDWRRLRALCVERLQKENKHTFVNASKIIQEINRKLSFMPDWKRHQFSEEYLEVDGEDLSKALSIRKVEQKRYLYLKQVYDDEREIETQIRYLSNRPPIQFRSPVTERHWYDYLFDSKSELAEKNLSEYQEAIYGQVDVCQRVFNSPLCVISGAAGTGKTTVINGIIKAIEKAHGAGTSFQLLAPTGKAADRLREATEKPAATIHSFLAQRGWLNSNLTFKRSGGTRELGISTYIIDESSMLDIELAATLFRAINFASVQRLILVGDPNQLPPIGRGRLFADIIAWLQGHNPDSIGTLTTNIRQMKNRATGRGTGILDLSSLYIREKLQYQGDRSGIEDKVFAEEFLKDVQEGGNIAKDLRVLYWKDPSELESLVVDTIIADMEKDVGEVFDVGKPYELWNKAHKGQNNSQNAEYMQILSPYRGEQFGTESINELIQNKINRHNMDRRGTLGGITYFDKVIQFINRPKSNPYWAYNISKKKSEKVEVYNGEIGFVRPHAFDKNDWLKPGFRIEKFQATFSRKQDYWIEFSSGSAVEQNIELAYCISVHKAQGSEFERVYFILPKSKKTLLSTELAYTGITRAKRHLTLFVEGDVSPLISLRRPESSHLQMINSSLFDFEPVPEEFLNIHSWYEEGKIHRTLSDYMVRSKSEVIIANMLYERDIPFKYEVQCFAPDGTFYLPDFTITWRGEEWYWEHLGLIDKEQYKNHWETKKAWYDKYFPGRLVTTIESPNISRDAEDLIRTHFS
jgi:exodeoxyribonuclease V alpha subunit